MVGDNGTVLTSPDAVNWTNRTASVNTAANPSGYSLEAIAYSGSGGAVVAAGLNGTVIASTDGINWVAQTPTYPSGTPSFYAVVADAVQYVLVGSSGAVYVAPVNTTVATTLTWANNSQASSTPTLYGLAGNQAFYVGVGVNGAVFTSK